MITFKQAASLSSSLLARKGSAVPAALVMSPHALVPHSVATNPVTPPSVVPQPSVSQPPAPARMEGWLPPSAPTEPAPRRRPEPPVVTTTPVPEHAKSACAKPDCAKGDPAKSALANSGQAAAPRGVVERKLVEATPVSGKSAKVSLRLDEERHRKLRLASVHRQLSGQQILLAALDAYLEQCAETVMDGSCACLNCPAE